MHGKNVDQLKNNQFVVLNQDEQFKWLWQNMPEKKKSNIDEVNKLDELISHLLKKNNQQNVCTPDTTTNENSK